MITSQLSSDKNGRLFDYISIVWVNTHCLNCHWKISKKVDKLTVIEMTMWTQNCFATIDKAAETLTNTFKSRTEGKEPLYEGSAPVSFAKLLIKDDKTGKVQTFWYIWQTFLQSHSPTDAFIADWWVMGSFLLSDWSEGKEHLFFFCEGYNRNQPFPPSHLENWKMFPSNRLVAALPLLLAGSLVVRISALHQDQCCSRKMVGSVPYSLLFRCATYVASLTPILSNHFVRHLFENDWISSESIIFFVSECYNNVNRQRGHCQQSQNCKELQSPTLA